MLVSRQNGATVALEKLPLYILIDFVHEQKLIGESCSIFIQTTFFLLTLKFEHKGIRKDLQQVVSSCLVTHIQIEKM